MGDEHPEPDGQYRADAVKALHLHLHHSWDHSSGPLDDEQLRLKAEVWVDASVHTMNTDAIREAMNAETVLLTVGSELAADQLARAVVQCAGPYVEPTQQDLTEALAVIGRMANPPTTS